MATLRVRLFGKFCVGYDEQVLKGFDSRKVQELFCYLLLHRHREHSREVLADLLWSDTCAAQSKAYLRKALWQLQLALDSQIESSDSAILLIDSDWIQLNPGADLWLDVAVFEQNFPPVQGLPGEKLDHHHAQALQDAVALYQADLLEGCYQDWCLYERQRLQHMYLTMLDKLMGYSEVHHEYEAGLSYGLQILRSDRAHESTHRKLMRLHYLAGDRTGALRQYERCIAALNEELDVGPSECTQALYEQIRTNRRIDLTLGSTVPEVVTPLPDALERLERLQTFLIDIQSQVQQSIQAIEAAMKKQAYDGAP